MNFIKNMTLRSIYQLVSQFHENSVVQEYVATPKGNIFFWLAIALLLSNTSYLVLLPFMILTQYFFAQRFWIMGLGGSGVFFYHKLMEMDVTDPLWFVVDIILVVVILYIFFKIAQSFSKLPRIVRSNPQIFLHLLFWLCIIPATFFPKAIDPDWVLPADTIVWLIFSFIIWRVGMMLYAGKRGKLQQTHFVEHLFYCLPGFGGTQVPYGKGSDYLNSKRANTPTDLIISQLAGMKLLLLVVFLKCFQEVTDIVVFGLDGDITGFSWQLPAHLYAVEDLIDMDRSQLPSLVTLWASLIADMIDETVTLAIRGHLVIGCLRLFGFNVFRNTYKPLLATTLSDFWNRYYYYFKELLVDFFFFPVYLSYFKKRPKLRIFAAIMASAFIGNFYYHFLQHYDKSIRANTILEFTNFQSYFFYTFILGIAIFISLLREQNRRGQPLSSGSNGWVTIRKIAGVWLFFAIMRIWDHSNANFLDDTTFFLALFGLHI
ncbi:MAG: hypothetical protein H7832_12560 [Magnetococcus sp. DMHC-6]